MKRAIPQTPKANEPRSRFDDAIKENLEIIMGHRGTPITFLADNASQAEIITKINEIVTRLQK